MCSTDSPSWTEPGAVMLMSWFIFLGAAVGVRENYHLGFDVLLYVLPKGGKKWLRMISDLVALAFGIGMIWYGGQLVGLTWNTTLPSLGISGGWDYVPLVAGGVLVVLFTLERIVLRLVRRADRRCARRTAAGGSRGRTRHSEREGLTPWNSGSCSASSRC